MTGFAHSQTTNKLVNKAVNDSARVSGHDRKKPPALGTNQIAGYKRVTGVTSFSTSFRPGWISFLHILIYNCKHDYFYVYRFCFINPQKR